MTNIDAVEAYLRDNGILFRRKEDNAIRVYLSIPDIDLPIILSIKEDKGGMLVWNGWEEGLDAADVAERIESVSARLCKCRTTSAQE